MTEQGWRSIHDLPPLTSEEEDDEIRCVVVWQDAYYDLDVGAEVATMGYIRGGVYDSPEYLHAEWRSIMDATAFAKQDELTEVELP